jgi:hypothetical protein
LGLEKGSKRSQDAEEILPRHDRREAGRARRMGASGLSPAGIPAWIDSFSALANSVFTPNFHARGMNRGMLDIGIEKHHGSARSQVDAPPVSSGMHFPMKEEEP